MFFARPASIRQTNAALLIMRLVAGLSMAAHGYQKVFEYGLAGVTDNFTKMGVPMAGVAGPFVSILELVGGVALALGLLTRPVAMLLAIDMLVAAALVHLPAGFFAPKGVEITLLFTGMFAALAIAGGGAASVDALFDRSPHA